ncbi:hypothetical protein CFOL_v3_03152 [Cephalotus follicularis]|uniref:DnaJ domain-containing protein n=1 Tax=Cephalotus follicularis TaxID=3775 RepID=A0A1Q3AV67_CEPFO|nr:hypothetical protein CFOL_v3_03152 [Cephalotus follicularis]
MSSPSSPKSLYRNSDIDFNDVFGGPPRKISIQDIWYSFRESTDSITFITDDDAATCRSSLSGLSEKPVFGEGVNRRRCQSQDFFNDIFKGNESVSSSPRKQDPDPFSSGPGSRVLSPAISLPPKADHFASSLPAEFSLPAKLTKGIDIPTFGSSSRSQSRFKDGVPNGSSYYSYSPLSRFSIQANEGQEDSRDTFRSSDRQSPLFHELSISSEESLNLKLSDEIDTGGNAKNDASNTQVSENASQFHFSIYKWASKGAPLVMPFRRGNSSRQREIKNERRSSSNRMMESVSRVLSTATSHEIVFPSKNNRISADNESFGSECEKQISDSLVDTTTLDGAESCQIVEDLQIFATIVKDVPNTMLQDTSKQTRPHSLPESYFGERKEKEACVTPKETQKPESKPLFSLLLDDANEQGIAEITGNAKSQSKERKVKGTKKSFALDASKRIKKQDGKRLALDKPELQGPHEKGDLGKNSAMGKVKEFVKLFSQDTSSQPKFEIDSQSHSFPWTDRGTATAESDPSISTSGTNEKIEIGEQHSAMKKPNSLSNDTTSVSSTASILNSSNAAVGDIEESFQVNFTIEELIQDDNKLPQIGNNPEHVQGIDTKIRQWSYGKEGNIRSLLSTLQYVLWPESGWKPVPLVDIIEGNAVKRSYQKALLCLHPDKLQQKGAASHQKYLAEKVFDILQEAWIHFNSLGSL